MSLGALQKRPGPALVLSLALCTAQSGFLVLTPVLPDVARDLGVSTAAAGALRVASGLAGAIVALALSPLGRRLGLRDLIGIGLVLTGGGSAAGAAASSFAVLAASQLAVGAGNAIILSAAVAAAGRWSARPDRARVLSIALLGQPASWVGGMPLIGVLASTSWRLAMCLPSVAAVVTLLLLAGRPRDRRQAEEGKLWALLRRDRTVAGWAVGELLAYAGWGGTLTFAGALMIESYGSSPGIVALLLGLSAAAYFPGSMLARRRAGEAPRQLLAVLGAGLAVALTAFGLLRTGLPFSVLLFALIVMLAGARTLAGSAAGLASAPPQRELSVMSIRAAATQLGTVAGAALGGAALVAGGYGLLGIVLAMMFAAGAVPHLKALRIASVRPGGDRGRPRKRAEAECPGAPAFKVGAAVTAAVAEGTCGPRTRRTTPPAPASPLRAADGRGFIVRPTHRSDRALYDAGFAALSARSRYLRLRLRSPC